MNKVYESLRGEVNKGGFGTNCHAGLVSLFDASAGVLRKLPKTDATSKVDGKQYFVFSGEGSNSRPINVELFDRDHRKSVSLLGDLLAGRRRKLLAEDITRGLYSVAATCCAARDVTSRGDRKTQGTIFEYLCAAVVQAALGIEPKRALPVMNLDLKGNLPTDFIFDLGEEKPKFHLPVKTSTRERIIQVWAHQRVLDGVYGVGRFLAIPFVLTETKLDNKKLEVVEICLPWQWRLYQMHVACLWNVCYFDIPRAYRDLDRAFPRVGVSTIGEFLAKDGRLDELLESHGIAPQ